MPLDPHERFDVARDVHVRAFHDEIVILDVARGEYFALDAIGSAVWRSVCEGRSLAETVTALAAIYDENVARVNEDVRALLAELTGRKLLEIRGGAKVVQET